MLPSSDWVPWIFSRPTQVFWYVPVQSPWRRRPMWDRKYPAGGFPSSFLQAVLLLPVRIDKCPARSEGSRCRPEESQCCPEGSQRRPDLPGGSRPRKRRASGRPLLRRIDCFLPTAQPSEAGVQAASP